MYCIVIFALAFGCDPSSNPASRSRLAVEKSNIAAKRLFEIEPFKSEDGQLSADGSAWEGVAASGGQDIISKVTFDDHGSVVKVDVKMLSHPAAPVPGVDGSLRSNSEGHQAPLIPEVMPK